MSPTAIALLLAAAVLHAAWNLAARQASRASSVATRIAILDGMRSVADEVRERDRRDVARLSVDERIALALRLGELDLELYCGSRGLDRGSGLRRLRQQRQQGRVFSACMSLEES